MKFGICNEMFTDWDWTKACETAAQLGYHGVEIAPFTFADSVDLISTARRREIREVAAADGLEIIGLHWLLVKPAGLYITHPEAVVRDRTAAYFRKLIQFCADIGGRVLVIGSPKQRNLLPGVTADQAFDHAVEVFSNCLPTAEANRIVLAIEPLHPNETDFVRTAAEGIKLAEALAHPLFRLHLDVKAMAGEGMPAPDVIRSATRHLAHFHANDPNRLGPGMGEVRFEPIIAALREIGYNGYLSVEVFDFSPGPERIARESIAYLRRVTGEPE